MWIEILKKASKNNNSLKESEILYNLPTELHETWDNFMRGKTCPILDDGDHGVYSWDLSQFLAKFNK